MELIEQGRGGTVPPKINNVKIRTSVKKRFSHQLLRNIEEIEEKTRYSIKGKNLVFKRYHNFIVYRCEFIYIIFPHRGTVNITGIKNKRLIKRALSTFSNVFKVPKQYLGLTIVDNVTATGSYNFPINLEILKKYINKKLVIDSILSSASFNSSHFPGCFCRSNCIGTVAIFASGKFNIIGSKCSKHVNDLFSAMTVYINQLLMTIEKEQQSALLVG